MASSQSRYLPDEQRIRIEKWVRDTNRATSRPDKEQQGQGQRSAKRDAATPARAAASPTTAKGQEKHQISQPPPIPKKNPLRLMKHKQG